MLDRNGIIRAVAAIMLCAAVYLGVGAWSADGGQAAAQGVSRAPVGQQDPVRDTGRIHRDWKEACEAEARGQEVCFIYQQIQHSGRSAANVTVGYKGQSTQPVLVVNMPLGAILLPDGLRIETDKGVDGWAPFLFCDVRGCHVETEIAPDLLSAMQSGASAWLIVRDLRGQALRLKFSLLGFTGGLKSLRG